MPRARTLLVAYRGYGRSSGTPSQAALVDDAVRVVREFRAGRSAPLVLVGHSLGSGVAALATARMNGAVDALVLVSPFCSLTRIAAHHFPWLPIRLLLRDPFDVAAVATALPQRVTIVIAVDDRIVPAAESHRLAQTLETPPIVHELARADHNDVLDRAATWQAIAAVVDALALAGE
jgi:pimeloyl-ACP methyl ester carboxylesterase